MTIKRVLSAALFLTIALTAFGQMPKNEPPRTADAEAGALIDVTGYWVSIVDEDWRWRMVTPPKGDYASIPLNPTGIKKADTWDPARADAKGEACRAYGAAGLMRLPERLHITWADPNTLKVETDAGVQTRLFHFNPSNGKIGPPTLQGQSVASWQKQTQFRGFGQRFAGPTPGKGGSLRVVTTDMTSGYLRKNGVPYSSDAVLTEFFDRIAPDGDAGDVYLILTSVVKDPMYLNDTFITSEQYKREPDGSKWDPQPCKGK